ncbi:SacI homology domain containing protein [Amanita muscaria]
MSNANKHAATGGSQQKDVQNSSLYDYLVLVPTKEGLLMRPQLPGKRGDSTTGGKASVVRIRWKKAVVIEEVDGKAEEVVDIDWTEGVVVYGIIGVLELFSCSYLLVITDRTSVGHVLDLSHVIYNIKRVAAIPLVEDRARTVVNALLSQNAAAQRPSLIPKADARAAHSKKPSGQDQQSGPRVHFAQELGKEDDHMRSSSSSLHSSNSDLSADVHPSSPVLEAIAPRLSFWNKITKPAQDANAYASASAHLSDEEPDYVGQEPDELERLIHDKREEPSEVLKNIIAAFAPQPASPEERHVELETKIVRECVRIYSKGEMYFSYTFDITRSLQHKQERLAKSRKEYTLLADLDALPSRDSLHASQHLTQNMERVNASCEPYPTLPLWRRVDKQFWWNEWLAKPFIDAGLHKCVLPIMQGYYQTSTFPFLSEPDHPIAGFSSSMNQHEEESMIEYTIISRRSRDRAGLRYQRRGIDDEAGVANFVETETIMRVERESRENVFSYVEIRGSIPLYWTQTGYGLKPPPVLATDRTHDQTLDALKKHFLKTIPAYGPHTIVNLAEQHGKEGAITRAYREYVEELDSRDVIYCEYDFHAETRGMKYENIAKLTLAMERTFDSQGYLWISDGLIFSKQKAVFRVNCIDCLDRTNVVQSAFARYMLNKQLSALAFTLPATDKRTDMDIVFNNVWANNGDAISRAYAGTSALKGDFTRTGKRDLGGMLNDGMNSLARMYSSTFSDWFCQAVIDFMLGNRTITVFAEFLLKLQSTDPSDLVRLSKIRAEAIATCVSRVLPNGDRLLSGWTLFAPEDLNTKVGMKFEEKVLLLSYDYTLEEVKMYTRVLLGDLVSISRGAYILSPLEEASRNPEDNAGFIVQWLSSRQESRIGSYSVRNNVEDNVSPFAAFMKGIPKKGQSRLGFDSDKTYAAFKVLPVDPARIRRSSSTGDGAYAEVSDEMNNAATCREAVDLITSSIERASREAGGGVSVKDEDVVGLTEAEKMTSMYAKMEYGVKRLLWLGG